jgi:hypothetical protein
VIEVVPGTAEARAGVLDVHGRADDAAGGELGARAAVLGSPDTA